jgi:phosphoserine phosphatase
MTVFIFDLDGTITSKETLPEIAKHFSVTEEMEQLTHETIQGNIPFVESFIKRVHILGKLL